MRKVVQTLALATPLEEAIDQLSQQLAELPTPLVPTLVQLSTPLASLPAFTWLNAQADYPKLYWQSRDGIQEAATCGAVDTWQLDRSHAPKRNWQRFTTDSLAQNDSLDWRYYGGHGFTPGDQQVSELGGNQLYLPKFEYRRHHNRHWLIFYLALLPEQFQNQLQKAQQELSQLAEPTPFTAKALQFEQQQHLPDYECWAQLVEQITQPEQLQHTPKVVLCRETRLNTSEPANGWQLLRDWQGQQPNCYQFGIQTAADQSFFGCSPERLFKRLGHKVQTEALAGTCSKGKTPEQSEKFAQQLLQDKKNIHENELVADDILKQLRALTQTVQLESNAHLVELAQVNHLCRDIQGELKSGVSETEILQALHPTAAIGGLPRAAARSFIEQHEAVNRGWYAGAFGMIGDFESEFCVTIRSVQQQGKQLSLFAGAGIVAGSEPYAEWHELNSKLASAMAVMEASQGE